VSSLAATALVVAVLVVPLGALTASGALRRGYAVPLAIAAGALYPITWAVWYVRDERPRPWVARP
jgi:hypothetical protein